MDELNIHKESRKQGDGTLVVGVGPGEKKIFFGSNRMKKDLFWQQWDVKTHRPNKKKQN